jgi:hypothetical protein
MSSHAISYLITSYNILPYDIHSSHIMLNIILYSMLPDFSFYFHHFRQNINTGLAFIGLSLTRYNDSEFSNKRSVTRQSQFDFNLLQDREYKYFCSTNDDGWLAGTFEVQFFSFSLFLSHLNNLNHSFMSKFDYFYYFSYCYYLYYFDIMRSLSIHF